MIGRVLSIGTLGDVSHIRASVAGLNDLHNDVVLCVAVGFADLASMVALILLAIKQALRLCTHLSSVLPTSKPIAFHFHHCNFYNERANHLNP